MTGLLLAIQFLTIFPVKIKKTENKDLASALIYFPVVGLLIAAVLLVLNSLLEVFNLDGFALNTILVVLLTTLNGGLHLDGLSDTFDGLMSLRSKEEKLQIMHDPHIGAMGVISIICIMLLKIAFLTAISQSLKSTAIVLMCVISRWSMVYSIFSFPYARKEGKAKIFTDNINKTIFVFATITGILFAYVVWQINGLLILAIAAGVANLFSNFVTRKIGGITGDTLGAQNEISEVFILILIFIMERSYLWKI